jgi:NAD(P)-dependent dehydrogenase (short-subunit alcohol dehydrogenase family)
MGNLEGKVAIVTGGGRGLGRAIAEGFAKEGCLVVVTAAREQREIAAVVSAFGKDRCAGILADVTDPGACQRVAEDTITRFGRIDVLVNNAGRGMKYVHQDFLSRPTRFWETDPAVWKLIIDTNVNGPFFMTRAVVPRMLGRKKGTIINISMNYETMKRKGFSPYGPSKAALESETIIWAQDLEGTGITVNELLPGGATETGMIPDGLEPALRARLLRPEVVVPCAVFLASDQARSLSGRRFVATEWTPEQSQGVDASYGIGGS